MRQTAAPPREAASIHWASSTTASTGRSSAAAARRLNVEAHTRKRSLGVAGPRPSAPASAPPCGAGIASSRSMTGPKDVGQRAERQLRLRPRAPGHGARSCPAPARLRSEVTPSSRSRARRAASTPRSCLPALPPGANRCAGFPRRGRSAASRTIRQAGKFVTIASTCLRRDFIDAHRGDAVEASSASVRRRIKEVLMKRNLALPLAAVAALAALAAVTAPAVAQAKPKPDFVTVWNRTMVDALETAQTPAPPAMRIGAIVQSSVFDALNGIERKYTPIHVQPAAPPGASRQAAVVEAAYEALVTLFPAQKATFDAQLAASLAEHRGRAERPVRPARPGLGQAGRRRDPRPGGPATASTRRLRRTCSAPIPGTGSRHRRVRPAALPPVRDHDAVGDDVAVAVPARAVRPPLTSAPLHAGLQRGEDDGQRDSTDRTRLSDANRPCSGHGDSRRRDLGPGRRRPRRGEPSHAHRERACCSPG